MQEARDESSATITSLEQKIANLEDENQQLVRDLDDASVEPVDDQGRYVPVLPAHSLNNTLTTTALSPSSPKSASLSRTTSSCPSSKSPNCRRQFWSYKTHPPKLKRTPRQPVTTTRACRTRLAPRRQIRVRSRPSKPDSPLSSRSLSVSSPSSTTKPQPYTMRTPS